MLLEKEYSARDKILDAALVEFGTHGYTKASTNRIYQEAKVSKGLIFKIFQSKDNLFTEVFKRSLGRMLSEMELTKITDSHDMIEKMMAVVAWKLKYATSHPQDTLVMMEGFNSPPKEVQLYLQEHIRELTVLSTRSFFSDISMENIRDEYTKEDVLTNLEIGMIGLQEKYLSQKMTLDDMESFKDLGLKFLNTILKGMEKK